MTEVVMDSRKFLNQLNESAQSKVVIYSEHVQNMGQKVNKNWNLAALHAKTLFIEDQDTQQYYIANHVKSNGQIQISNIQPIKIVESEKNALFYDSCLKLTESLERNDQKGMQSAFSRMRSQRFSGRAIPFSGMVRCRDGIHNIRITNESIIDSDIRPQLVAAIVENLKDRVIVENGSVVSGNFVDGTPIKLPVTKWAVRKMIARKMQNSAENAYWSEGFQNRIYDLAILISEGKLEEAVKQISPFLEEMEEFTLLSSKKAKTLIENTLATKAVFNQQLCDDTSTLFHRTNLRINRTKIVNEWKNIAKKAEHSALMSNVHNLQESKNFENSYDKFLTAIFETISNREVAAEALATTLEVLKSRTPKIRESHELSNKLNGLISRLKQKNFDDASIYEAEDLIATIQEELTANETLNDFDSMPGDLPEAGEENPAIDIGTTSDGTPVININAPLIQVGGKSSAAKDEEEMPLETPEGGDDELDELLNPDPNAQMGQQPQQPQPQAQPQGGQQPAPGGQQFPSFEEKKKTGKTLKESRPVHYEMRDEDDTDENVEGIDEDSVEESRDPYSYERMKVKSATIPLMNYGVPALKNEEIAKVVGVMHGLAQRHNLSGKDLQEKLIDMADASIEAVGLRIPKGQKTAALEQVIAFFEEENCDETETKPKKEWKKPWENDDDDDNTDDEGVAEEQFKSPKIKRRGLKRSNFKPYKDKLNESINWTHKEDDAILGEYGGVKFIFDHGGDSNLDPMVLSEDGSIEIPIPKEYYESAFAAAKMREGNPKEFVDWLSESLEQLRPISSEEDRAIEEAVATITTSNDGSISVNVTNDVEVSDIESEMPGEELPDDDMAPVDSVIIDDEGESEGGLEGDTDEMPDFESKPEEVPPDGSEVPEELPVDFETEESDEMAPVDSIDDEDEVFEDKDIVSSKSTRYTKHIKDNKREMPSAKMPSKANDDLEGIGPSLKKDDGSGTKPPISGKGTSE